MKKLLVAGPTRLSGTVRIHGAKNSVLPILAACCLCCSPCVLHNCPDIADVRTALAILESLGCKARREGSTLCIDPTGLDRHCVEPRLAGKMRSSVLFLGALLARFSQAELRELNQYADALGIEMIPCIQTLGHLNRALHWPALARRGKARLALPGGCPLGDRPIDLHVKALSQLGVRFCFEEGHMCAVWHKRLDGDIRLPLPSVGATENLLLACALGKRTVNITGAAREPEIADLIGFLRAAGADISGAGTSSLQICGVSRLHGATYTILPDRIETATYLCMAAGCGGETELLRCDARLLLPVIERLREAGCEISADADRIVLRSSGRLLPLLPVSTAPYPGFPTDAQALLMAAVLKAAGGSEFRETIFERRFLHVPELRKLGADIQVAGSTARVRGVRQLHGAKLRAEDLRGAAALLTASMMAEGESELTGLCHLLRGYEKPEQNLKNLGAAIKSVDIPAPFVYNT